jgi:hypothetical protein
MKMLPPQVTVVVERRRRGRPPLDDKNPSAAVDLRVAPDDYDAVYRIAQRDRVTVNDVIRRAIRRLIAGESADV